MYDPESEIEENVYTWLRRCDNLEDLKHIMEEIFGKEENAHFQLSPDIMPGIDKVYEFNPDHLTEYDRELWNDCSDNGNTEKVRVKIDTHKKYLRDNLVDLQKSQEEKRKLASRYMFALYLSHRVMTH